MAEAEKKPSIQERARKFATDQRGEMKKIVWPSKKQVINSTKVVLGLCAITAVVVCCFDLILSTAISFLINL